MRTATIKLSKLHQKQAEIKDGLGRYTVLNCGRRFGKNIVDKDLAIQTMLAGFPVGWFEPTYKSLSEIWREIRSTLQPVTSEISEQEKRVKIVTGGILEMWSLENPDAGIGRKYKRVIYNEAASSKNLEYSWNKAVSPTLMDYRGDAIFSSTPKGLNYFFSLWAMADSDPSWRRFHFTTYDNPHIDPAEVDALKARLPERVFQQEIMAEFVEDGSYFQNIEHAAVIKTQDTPDQHSGHRILAGLDWAMSEDYTVLTIGCRECGRVVAWDRFNQIDYTYQRARILDNWQRWKFALLPERNSIGQPNIEILRAAGVQILSGMDGVDGFNTTATSKPELIQRLASGLEHDGFLVPAEYADELRRYEVITGDSGRSRFSAPEGSHDDRVISLALCYWAMVNLRRSGGIHL